MKLFTKYNRINLGVMMLVFILSGISYYLLISRIFIHELDEDLDDCRHKLHAFVQQHDTLPDFQHLDDVTVAYYPVVRLKKKKFSSVTHWDEEDKKNGAFRQVMFTETIRGVIYEFRVDKPVEGTRLVTKTIVFSTLVILLIIVIISVLLNRFILKKLWRPFYNTVQELRTFRLGNGRDPEFPASDIDEFSFLNQSLTEVIESVNNDYRILKEFTENAAHELQTPLAIIRSKLDLVIQEEGLSDNQGTALKSAYQAIHRLTKLNQSLLLLTKIENKQFSSLDKIDLEERIRDKISQFSEFWTGQKITVTADLEAAVITANTELTDILLNNLLSNAGRHNIEGGSIRIFLRPGTLSITNTANSGTLDPARLFTRFYKEAAYSHSNGLGLSIIKQICDGSQIVIHYEYINKSHTFSLSWQH